MKEYKIVPPSGHRLVETIEGDVKVISFEAIEVNPKEVDLQSLIDKVSLFRVNSQHLYFIDSNGKIENVIKVHANYAFNNNTKNTIKAQQLQLIYKGLVEMYDDIKLDYNNHVQNKYFIYLISDSIMIDFNNEDKLQGIIYASSKEILEKVIEEMGEDNVIFMIKNI